jgi:diguanylate cyclase (GGDEF)-like protein
LSEAAHLLRSCVRLVGRLSGAASVSLYLPPGAGDEREFLIHEGPREPLPELADSLAAEEFHRANRDRRPESEEAVTRVASRDGHGVLYEVPLRWVLARGDEEAPGVERRRREALPATDATAWIGLRWDSPIQAGPARAAGFPGTADPAFDERWWKSLLGLAAAFGAHARALSRTAFDPVTGLPERADFLAELEAALLRARRDGLPVVLLLLGPEDFGWVNERLDRRSGDRVLREIATALRAGLRSTDHVARYGGATFTAVLPDTSAETGAQVAQNIVCRLGEQRYHSEILRLEFSAGVAAAGPDDLVDAHELIRRADQALSAAKRGSAGNVRLWEKGSDVESASSLDRLQGIFTGDKSKDYRNMRLLLEAVAVVASCTEPAELAASFSERLLEILHARRAGVLERRRDGGFDVLGGLERSEDGKRPFAATERDLALLERACRDGDFIGESGNGAGELSLFALPLLLQKRCLGGILLEVSPFSLSFEGSDRRFLDALASEMAVALDRARLIGRERDNERREKERLQAEVTDLRRVAHGSRLAYRSPEMDTLLATARRVARTDATVLITGESGTGKEVLALTLHELSARHERPVVVVDCSAISPTLIETELFGHERGAFTGAHARKLGRLAQADRATLFMDEIGELPLDLQSKLLRFVQEKQFTPVGGVGVRKVDVRIIAATNRDLRARVLEGRFREDLYHRLNVVRLHVPPLRERRDDILHLARMFLQQFAALYRRPAHRFTPAAERALEEHAWPGNVRELQNMVLTSVLFCDGPEVDVSDLQGFESARARTSPESATAAAADATAAADPELRLRKALQAAISSAIGSDKAPAPIGKWLAEDLVLGADRVAGGVSRRAAELLGLPETTYRRQLQTAMQRRAAGLAVRSPWWPAVASVLEKLILEHPPNVDVCEWAETCLLVEIESAAGGSPRTAAALLGVTEPTLYRRRARLTRHS